MIELPRRHEQNIVSRNNIDRQKRSSQQCTWVGDVVFLAHLLAAGFPPRFRFPPLEGSSVPSCLPFSNSSTTVSICSRRNSLYVVVFTISFSSFWKSASFNSPCLAVRMSCGTKQLCWRALHKEHDLQDILQQLSSALSSDADLTDLPEENRKSRLRKSLQREGS